MKKALFLLLAPAIALASPPTGGVFEYFEPVCNEGHWGVVIDGTYYPGYDEDNNAMECDQ